MFIRRKVFSLLQDQNGEERYYSTTEFVNEGAEERYYSEDEEAVAEEGQKKGLSKKAKIALGIGAGALATAGGIYGAKKLGGHLQNKALKMKNGQGPVDYKKMANYDKLGKNLQKPADAIAKGSKEAWTKAKGLFTKKTDAK